MNLTYSQRIPYCQSIIAKKLLKLMDEKKTNLALSLDVTRKEELIHLAKTLGPYISVLKTHIDIVDDFDPQLIKELQAIARDLNFLIFEDRKFADIGHTVKQQYQQGIYHIVEWADIINAHSLPGPSIIEGLFEVAKCYDQRGLLLIAEMSSRDHLFNTEYMQKTLRLAERFPQFVFGFITQHAININPAWLNFTPGIHLAEKGDCLGQQYRTPFNAIVKDGADVIIVGRAIIRANEPIKVAQLYRDNAFYAYQQRCEIKV